MNSPPDPVLAAWRAYLDGCTAELVRIPAELYADLHERVPGLPACVGDHVVVQREQLVAALNAVKEMGGGA